MERNIKGRKDDRSSSNGSRQNNNSRENGTEGNLTFEELLAAWYLILLAANLVTNFTQRSLMASSADVMASNNVWYPQHIDAYYCWLCGTHLAEFQGLGDPFACHNYWQAQTEESSSSRPPTKRQRVAKPHECKTCGRVFSTGQAMGGYMRAHYRDDLTRSRPAMASSSSSVAADGHIGEVGLENNVGSSVADYDDAVSEVVDSKSNIINQIGNNSSRGSTSNRPVDLDLNVKLEDESEVEEDPAEEEIDRVDGA